MSRFLASSLPEETPEVNLTPLIDVVFVVLIVFMIIAPLIERDQVQLPGGKTASEKIVAVKDQSPISLYVHQDNTLWVGKKQIAMEQLSEWLATSRQLHPEATPQLFCDKRASFGIYQQIKNTFELAGFESIDIVLQPA